MEIEVNKESLLFWFYAVSQEDPSFPEGGSTFVFSLFVFLTASRKTQTEPKKRGEASRTTFIALRCVALRCCAFRFIYISSSISSKGSGKMEEQTFNESSGFIERQKSAWKGNEF